MAEAWPPDEPVMNARLRLLSALVPILPLNDNAWLWGRVMAEFFRGAAFIGMSMTVLAAAMFVAIH